MIAGLIAVGVAQPPVSTHGRSLRGDAMRVAPLLELVRSRCAQLAPPYRPPHQPFAPVRAQMTTNHTSRAQPYGGFQTTSAVFLQPSQPCRISLRFRVPLVWSGPRPRYGSFCEELRRGELPPHPIAHCTPLRKGRAGLVQGHAEPVLVSFRRGHAEDAHLR